MHASLFPLLLIAIFMSNAAPGTALADDQSDCASAEPKMSIKSCTRIIERDQVSGHLSGPELSKAHNKRGRAYEKLGARRKALADYKRAVSLDQKNVQALSDLGNHWRSRGKLEKALMNINRALALEPNFAEAYLNRGKLHSRKGAYDKAFADFDKALTLDPKMSEAFSHRGMAFYNKRQFDNALADFSAALAINPNAAAVYKHRALIYLKLGKNRKAIRDFDKSIALDPLKYLVHLFRGETYLKIGEFDKAIIDFTSTLALSINSAADGAAYGLRGRAYRKKGLLLQAAIDLERALGKARTYTDEDYILAAQAWKDAGKPQRGLRHAKTATSLYPKSAKAWETLGSLQEALGKTDEAIKAYRKALALDPKHEAGRDHLKRLDALP